MTSGIGEGVAVGGRREGVKVAVGWAVSVGTAVGLGVGDSASSVGLGVGDSASAVGLGVGLGVTGTHVAMEGPPIRSEYPPC